VQADVVAHSMGGDIARTMAGLSNFTSQSNYGLGPIHKLITIGTPHLGTPLATDLIDSKWTSEVIGDGMTDVWSPARAVQGCVGDLFSRHGKPPVLGRIMGMQKCSLRIPASQWSGDGTKMVAVWSAPESGLDLGWKQIPDTSYYLHSLTE
jgi:hypothetical protein